MARYVTHKHGLTIGSDNVFFVIDRDDPMDLSNGLPPMVLPEGVKGVRDDYRAIVTVEHYWFDQATTRTVDLLTPAQQLIWRVHTETWEKPWEYKGATMMLPYQQRWLRLQPWVEDWLTRSVGPKYDKWDMQTRERFLDGTLFFKRRKDALAFVRMIGGHLKGIRVGL